MGGTRIDGSRGEEGQGEHPTLWGEKGGRGAVRGGWGEGWGSENKGVRREQG